MKGGANPDLPGPCLRKQSDPRGKLPSAELQPITDFVPFFSLQLFSILTASQSSSRVTPI